MKKPLVVSWVLTRNAIVVRIQNQGLLNQIPAIARNFGLLPTLSNEAPKKSQMVQALCSQVP